MPAATTHVEFSKDVYEGLPAAIREKITNLHMYWLGSQGPDVLFFSRASVLPGSLKRYGGQMHDEKVLDVISFFEDYAKDDPDLYSYFCGYLCHYSLDSLAHPLINAVARHVHETEGVHEGEAHVTMEGDIDVWLLAQRGKAIKDYDVYRYLKTSAADRKKLGAMYAAMFRSVFDLDFPEKDFARAAWEIAFLTKAMRPRPFTYEIVAKAEDKAGMPHSISGMMLKRKHDFTIINIDKKAYPLVFDTSRTISASFPELYGKAVYLARRLLVSHDDSDFVLNFSGEPYEN